MTLKRYTLSVASPEDWANIHGALIVDSNEDGIPDRKITCTDEKTVSPTRGTYELTEEEVGDEVLRIATNFNLADNSVEDVLELP